MTTPYSPTGYWAHYLFTKEFLREVNAGRQAGSERTPVDVHLPVVTWTSDGSAAVFDLKGRLTPAGDLYPAGVAEYWAVDASPNWGE